MNITHRLLACLLMSCSLLLNFAQPADSLLLKVDDREIAFLDIHVRRSGADWSFVWDYTDSLNYREVRVRMTGGAIADNIFGYTSEADVRLIANGHTVCNEKVEYTHSDNQSSVRFRYIDDKVYLSCGDGTNISVAPSLMVFDCKPESKIMVRNNKVSKPIRCISNVVYRKRFKPSRFDDTQHLLEYLKHSTDSIEGLWEYFDSDINTPAVQLGGNYVFASVRNTTGSYDLIYLDGMRLNQRFWQPFMVRAHLLRTIFINNFDVEWLNSDRTEVYDYHDVYAQFEQNSIMSLYFPEFKSKMRFRRQRITL